SFSNMARVGVFFRVVLLMRVGVQLGLDPLYAAKEAEEPSSIRNNRPARRPDRLRSPELLEHLEGNQPGSAPWSVGDIVQEVIGELLLEEYRSGLTLQLLHSPGGGDLVNV